MEFQKCAVEKTPSGGWHVVFRSPHNHLCEKLITDPSKTEAMIEIKAEGGYFVCAPTQGWELKAGSFVDLKMLTEIEAQQLLSVPWALERKDAPAAEPVKREMVDGKSPFDDYNERATFDDLEGLLLGAGWRRVAQKGENVHYCRPDKQGKTTSATLHVSRRVFFVFTSNSQFDPNKGYGPAGLYATIAHNGDFKAAARLLVSKGYGTRGEHKKAAYTASTGVSVSSDNLGDELVQLYRTPFYPGESTGWPNIDEILKVERGQLNILFGVPSHGKSSFLDALMVNVVLGCKWNALIFSPENKSRAYHASKLCEIITRKPMYGDGRMTESELLSSGETVARHFTFLTQSDGGSTLDEILEQVKIRKPEFVVIDPWNRLNHVREEKGVMETEYIGNCLSKTSALVKNLNLSFWFVVHPQKIRRDKTGALNRPGFYDVAGSANWANMADNGILVWRDFDKEVTEIETVKVRYRHNGSAGIRQLKFNRPNGTFTPYSNQQVYTDFNDRKSLENGEGKIIW